MTRARLSEAEQEALRDLQHCTGRTRPEHARLEALGLVQTGRGRFGDWARLTELGRGTLAHAAEAAPAPSPTGLDVDEGTSSGEHAPGRAVGAQTKRRRRSEPTQPVAISPPATSLVVGAASPSQTPKQGAVKAPASVRARRGKTP